MKLDRSIVINRPPSVVFDFVAVNHLHNHPRWDPHMELQQLTDGPVGIGTRYQRRHTRIGTPIEGTMEASLDPTMIEGSLRRMKELIEAET